MANLLIARFGIVGKPPSREIIVRAGKKGTKVQPPSASPATSDGGHFQNRLLTGREVLAPIAINANLSLGA